MFAFVVTFCIMDRFPIQSLCMKRLDVCMLCDQKYELDTMQEVHLEFNYGLIYCKKCYDAKKVHGVIYDFFSNIRALPFSWIFKSEKFKNPDGKDNKGGKYLSFFRYSQRDTSKPIQTWQILPGECMARFNKMTNQFSIMLRQYNTAESLTFIERGVTLSNLFAHNPGLYDELINCKNLLNHDKIMFTYYDLPANVRLQIEQDHKLSQQKDTVYKY